MILGYNSHNPIDTKINFIGILMVFIDGISF